MRQSVKDVTAQKEKTQRLKGEWKKSIRECEDKDKTLKEMEKKIAALIKGKELLEQAQIQSAEGDERVKNDLKQKDEKIAALTKEKEIIKETHELAVSSHRQLSEARSQDLERVQQELSNTREQLAQCQGHISGLTQEKKDLEKDHERAVMDIDLVKETHAQELEYVQKELAEARAQLAQKDKQAAALIKEKETLEEAFKLAAETSNSASAQELALVQGQLNDTKRELEQREKEIHILEEDVTSTKVRCDWAEKELTDIEKRFSEFKGDRERKVELEKELQDMRGQLVAKDKQLGEQDVSQERLQIEHATELQHLHERKSELEVQMEGISCQLAETANALKEKKESMERKQNETAKISEQLEQLRGASQERDTLRTELEEVKSRAADLQVNLDAVPPRSEIERLQIAANDTHKLQEELDMAKNKIADLEAAQIKTEELEKLSRSVSEDTGLLTSHEDTDSENGEGDAHTMDLEA
jgi:chromosome segregation ATPase